MAVEEINAAGRWRFADFSYGDFRPGSLGHVDVHEGVPFRTDLSDARHVHHSSPVYAWNHLFSRGETTFGAGGTPSDLFAFNFSNCRGDRDGKDLFKSLAFEICRSGLFISQILLLREETMKPVANRR